MRFNQKPWQCLSLLLLALAAAVVSGCSEWGGNANAELYKQEQETLEGAMAGLKADGAKFEREKYREGEGWAVDLREVKTINDGTFKALKTIGMYDHITNLNFSGKPLTDEQMVKLCDFDISSYLVHLDLSNTAIKDTGFAELQKTAFVIKDLNVAGTGVTPAAIDAYLKSRDANEQVYKMYKKPKITK